MFDVACVGILVADVVTRTVHALPDTGKLDLVDHIDLFSGGCAVSSAVDMSRIGLRTAVSGKIGRDGFGSFLRNVLRTAGVADGFVAEDQTVGTSASVVVVDGHGERSFLHCLGANATFTDTDVPDELLKQSKIAFVAGTMLMPAFDGAPCARVLQRAHAIGCMTALDTAWDAKGRWMDVLAPCMPHIDLFLPSYDEAVALSGEREPAIIAEQFLGLGVGTCVIKLGAEGCFIRRGAESWTIPGFPVSEVKDTTGAGDAFCAGFLTGYSLGLPLPECGRMANAVGALCVSDVGASSGIHSMEQVRNLMR